MKKLLDIYEGIFNTNDDDLNDVTLDSYLNDENSDFRKQFLHTACDVEPAVKNIAFKYQNQVLDVLRSKTTQLSLKFYPDRDKIKNYLHDLNLIKMERGLLLIKNILSTIDENSVCRNLCANSIILKAKKIQNLNLSSPDKIYGGTLRINSESLQNTKLDLIRIIYFDSATNIINCESDNALQFMEFYDPFLFDEPIDWLDDKIDWGSAEILDLTKDEYIDSSKLTRKKVLTCYNNDKRYKIKKAPILKIKTMDELFPKCKFPNLNSVSLRNNRVRISLTTRLTNKRDIGLYISKYK